VSNVAVGGAQCTPVIAVPPPRRRISTDVARVALFRDAAAVVDAELGEPITLDKVAERVSASPRQLRRVFAEAGDTTFGAYVREARMTRAAELLSATDLPVGEVATTVGYTQPGQFTKAFRRSFGTTPSGYRGRER
jgi:transcriptional regulator GlxA family with amidase domain